MREMFLANAAAMMLKHVWDKECVTMACRPKGGDKKNQDKAAALLGRFYHVHPCPVDQVEAVTGRPRGEVG